MSFRVLSGLVADALLILVVCSAAAAADPPPSTRVAQEWAAREAKAKTGRVTLNITETHAKEFVFIGQGDPKKQKRPSTDVKLPGTAVITFDQGKVRYEYDGCQWSPKTGTTEPRAAVTTYNGSQFAITALKTPVVDHPESTITGARAQHVLSHLRLRPIWYTVRGSLLAETGSFKITAFSPSGRQLTVNDRVCFEYTRLDTSSGREEHLYLDPERSFQVVRRTEATKGTVDLQLDIQYAEHPLVGWVPRHWDYVVRTPTGAALLTGRVEAGEFEFNEEYDASIFDPVLPPKARVADVTSGQEVQYGVLPDGTKGREVVVTPGTVVEYSTLMEPPNRGWSAVRLFVVLIPAVSAIIILAVYLARRRKRAAT